MKETEKIELVHEFIKAHTLAVLSTVTHDGKPESAVLGVSETDHFKLIFGTFFSSRKYANLKNNPNVSLVIGWEKGKTVQLEGVAEEITDQAEIDESMKIHLSKIPSAAKFLNRVEERLFKIKPIWARYSDLSVDPWNIFEIRF